MGRVRSLRWLLVVLFFVPSLATNAESPYPARMPTYPDDAYSRPRQDRLALFETLSGVSLAPDVVQRAILFHTSEINPGSDGGKPCTRWQFRRKAGNAGPVVLGLDEKLRRLPVSISLRATNRSADPLQFAMHLHEMPWQPTSENKAIAWKLPPQEVAPGATQVLKFHLDKASAERNSEKRSPVFPMGGMQLVVSGAKAETSYEILLSDLTVEYPDAAGIEVVELAPPVTLEAGQRVEIALQIAGSVKEGNLDLEIRREPWILWRVRLEPKEVQALNESQKTRIMRTVPWYLAPGDASIGLVAGGLRAKGKEAAVRIAGAGKAELPRAERRPHNGRPTFFLNGKPFSWNGYSSYDFQPGNVKEFGQSGVNAMCIPADAGQHIHQVAAPILTGPDRYDFGQIEERVGMALQANAEAVLFLRVSLAMPPFWFCNQADRSDRATVRTPWGDLPWTETGTPAGSLASERWRQAQAESLRRLLRYCANRPWASRLAGIWLTGEVTEEWFAWGANDRVYSDYSRANQDAFREWCKGRGLATRDIPDPAVRSRGGYDVYPADPSGQAAAAYAEYSGEKTAETIDYFAKVVKEETHGRTLVGVFWGYVIQLAGEPRQHTSGQLALRQVLASPHVDFLAGIPLLDYRDLTAGYSAFVSATESIAAAGKLYCNENDLFSYLHPILWHVLYDPKDPVGALISMHRRELANDAVHGAQLQWFSLMSSWHHGAELQRDFRRQIEINRKSLDYDRSPAEEIAFLVDDHSFPWCPPETTLPGVACKEMLKALGRTGAPVGVWLLSDVNRLPDRIRFVVVAHAPAARPEDIQHLREAIEKGGRTFLLIGPVGLVDPKTQTWKLEATKALTGLPIRIEEREGPGIARRVVDGLPVTNAPKLRPRAYADVTGGIQYTDGKSATAERPLAHNGRLIWCGAPPVVSSVLRGWLEASGVHLYAPEGFFVHASKELVAITANAAGTATIRWPRRVAVKDLFDGWTDQGQEMAVPFRAGQTRLLAVEKE